MGGKGMAQFTDDSFEQDVLQSEIPVLVDFTATWCGPCKHLVPILEKVAEEYDGRVLVGSVDVDANKATAMKYLVRSIPTLILINDGKVVEQSVGVVNANKLKGMLEKVL